jgi:hypothetical protein
MNHIEAIRKTMPVQRITLATFNGTCPARNRTGGQNVWEIDKNKKLPTKVNVGGGTAFAPCFEWIKTLSGVPDGILIFTDLECYQYGEKPAAPVLWISTSEIFRKDAVQHTNMPPFGEAIQIDLFQSGHKEKM